MWKISSNFIYYCIEWKSVVTFQDYTEFKTSEDYIFHILQYFATKLYNFTKLRMLFAAVLMNIPNSNVCPQGIKLTIVPQKVKI